MAGAKIARIKSFLNTCPGFDSALKSIQIRFMKASKIVDEIIIDAKVLKAGKSLAYTKVDLKNKATGDLLVTGFHTRYILSKNPVSTADM